VKKSESDQIVRAMRQKGLEVEYLVYPDEGHGFARPQNRVSFYAAAERFLARHLGGHAEPVSEAEVKLLATVSVTGTPDQPIVAKE
jgi:dienelactone hydrolase